MAGEQVRGWVVKDAFGVSKGLPPYGRVPGIGRVKINGQHSKDLFDVTDKTDTRRLVPRARLMFVKSKPLPRPEPPKKPKWEQGVLFGKVLDETPQGWVVRSKEGKRLSKPSSRAQAAKRLRQIEYFKHQKG